MTDKISDDDDFPRDTCFTCNVSPTAAERSGFRRAIDVLRLEAAALKDHPEYATSPVLVHQRVGKLREAADFLESLSDGSQT